MDSLDDLDIMQGVMSSAEEVAGAMDSVAVVEEVEEVVATVAVVTDGGDEAGEDVGSAVVAEAAAFSEDVAVARDEVAEAAGDEGAGVYEVVAAAGAEEGAGGVAGAGVESQIVGPEQQDGAANKREWVGDVVAAGEGLGDVVEGERGGGGAGAGDGDAIVDGIPLKGEVEVVKEAEEEGGTQVDMAEGDEMVVAVTPAGVAGVEGVKEAARKAEEGGQQRG